MHVFEHLVENPKKPTHTVFNVDNSSELLTLLDEAYITSQKLNLKPVPNDPGAFVIPMGKVVGTKGETSIKLVVKPGTTNVISAYPVK